MEPSTRVKRANSIKGLGKSRHSQPHTNAHTQGHRHHLVIYRRPLPTVPNGRAGSTERQRRVQDFRGAHLDDAWENSSVGPDSLARSLSPSPRSSVPYDRLPYSNQLVLYDTKNKQLVVHESDRTKYLISHSHGNPSNMHFDEEDGQDEPVDVCPTCQQPISRRYPRNEQPFFNPNYFMILAEAWREESSNRRQNQECLPAASEPDVSNEQVVDMRRSDSFQEIPRSRQNSMPSYSDVIDSQMFNQGYFDKFFIVEKVLGRGTFGVVLLCRHVLDDSILGTFAVKKVPVGNDRNWLSRTLSEVTSLQRLRHPNIVDYKHCWIELSQTTDLGPSVPCLFILMEYAQRGSLHELLHPQKPETAEEIKEARKRKRKNEKSVTSDQQEFLSEDVIWSLLYDTCQGLRYLHKLKIIHADVKPQNLLLDVCPTSGRLKILISDFGTSKQIETLGHDAKLIRRTGHTGTIDFTAPEVLMQDANGSYINDYCDKADMWSLGIVLYEMCFGTLPWMINMEGQTWQHQVIHQIMDNQFTIPIPPPKASITTMCPERSPEIIAVLCSLLQRDKELRPSSEEIFHLDAFIKGVEQSGFADIQNRGRSTSVNYRIGTKTSATQSSPMIHHTDLRLTQAPVKSTNIEQSEGNLESNFALVGPPTEGKGIPMEAGLGDVDNIGSTEQSTQSHVDDIHNEDHPVASADFGRPSKRAVDSTRLAMSESNLRSFAIFLLILIRYARICFRCMEVESNIGSPAPFITIPFIVFASVWSREESRLQRRKYVLLWVLLELFAAYCFATGRACSSHVLGTREPNPASISFIMESVIWILLAQFIRK